MRKLIDAARAIAEQVELLLTPVFNGGPMTCPTAEHGMRGMAVNVQSFGETGRLQQLDDALRTLRAELAAAGPSTNELLPRDGISTPAPAEMGEPQTDFGMRVDTKGRKVVECYGLSPTGEKVPVTPLPPVAQGTEHGESETMGGPVSETSARSETREPPTISPEPNDPVLRQVWIVTHQGGEDHHFWSEWEAFAFEQQLREEGAVNVDVWRFDERGRTPPATKPGVERKPYGWAIEQGPLHHCRGTLYTEEMVARHVFNTYHAGRPDDRLVPLYDRAPPPDGREDRIKGLEKQKLGRDRVIEAQQARIDNMTERMGVANSCIDALEREVAALNSKTYCAFCGQEFPIDDKAEEVGQHIRLCPKHPMRDVERERDDYRRGWNRSDAHIARLQARVAAGDNLEEAARVILNAINGLIVTDDPAGAAFENSAKVFRLGEALAAYRATGEGGTP